MILRRTFLALLVMGLSLAWSPTSHASHYPLDSLTFLTEAEISALKKIPVRGTKDGGIALANPKQRKGVANKIGLPEERLSELASLFDLMRVQGAGPKMARLFRIAEVTSCVSLAKEDPVALLDKLRAANYSHNIASKLPDAQILTNWIKQASALPPQYIIGKSP
ncbi:MAG: hypothetical protein CMH54_00850 [Myxococcales bacterium]|nr:hypothetical protein [Myxococcales bacterium]|tara:strand:- start:596 stop:1090 length:495 start_codon:yes stop_codon:yes gene_type:complete